MKQGRKRRDEEGTVYSRSIRQCLLEGFGAAKDKQKAIRDMHSALTLYETDRRLKRRIEKLFRDNTL